MSSIASENLNSLEKEEMEKSETVGMFRNLPVNRFLCSLLLSMSYPSRAKRDEPEKEEQQRVVESEESSAKRVRRGAALNKALLNRITSTAFMRMTKKMRQQVLTRMFNGVHNQLVVYNIKSLFRVYLIYHREDALIHTICDVFNKRFVFDAAQLRAEILAKNTKPFSRKVMRNKMCNDVMLSNPNILRLFDLRALAYYRNHLLDSTQYLHCLSNGLPVIMCLNESDVDYIFERCRTAHSRRRDFPIDLLPSCIRASFSRLLGLLPGTGMGASRS